MHLSDWTIGSGGYEFFLRQGLGVKEGLNRGFAEAPSALMRPFDVVPTDPVVQIDLQLCDRAIDLFPERDAVELVEDRLVKALDNSIRLWALGFGPGMIDVFDGQVEFVFVVLGGCRNIPCPDQSERGRA